MFKKSRRLRKKVRLMEIQNITKNSPLDKRCLQSPFSINLDEVDHVNFLAKSEQVQQHKNLLLCVEEHCQTPFGGPIKDPVAWVHLQKYLNFRGMGIEKSSQDLTPSVEQLINSGRKALVRCQTPPPAKDLFIGFFENDEYGWSTHVPSSPTFCEHRELMDHDLSGDCTMKKLTKHVLHKDLSKKQKNTSCDTDSLFTYLQLKDANLDKPCLNILKEIEETVLKKPVQQPCIMPVQSVLDHPSKVEHGFVKPSSFHRCYENVQASRYTKEMTRYVVKLHEELQNVYELQDARTRIRQRAHQSSLPNIEPQEFEEQNQNVPYSFKHGLEVCLENMSLHTTSVEEESFLIRYAWYPRGLTLKDSMTLEFPLHHAWDIGKRGCVAKVTIVPENLICESYNVKTRLRFLVLNGTNIKFVTCYGIPKHSKTPTKNFKKTINVNDMRDASWNLSSRQVRVCVQNNETSSFLMILHGLTLPFFSALLTLIRYIEASRHIQMINHRRIYLETFDREISYAKSLRKIILETKAMLWNHVEEKKPLKSKAKKNLDVEEE